MNQYETVEILEKIEGLVNNRRVSLALELQSKINEDGRKGNPYPILKVNINGREQFYFIDIAEKVHEMLGQLLPKALQIKSEHDAAFKSRREAWEKRQQSNPNIGQGRIVVPPPVEEEPAKPPRRNGKDRRDRDEQDD